MRALIVGVLLYFAVAPFGLVWAINTILLTEIPFGFLELFGALVITFLVSGLPGVLIGRVLEAGGSP